MGKTSKVYVFNALKDLNDRVAEFDAGVLKANKPFLLLKHWEDCGHCVEFTNKVFTPAFKQTLSKKIPIVEIEYSVHKHLQDSHPDHPLSLQMRGTPDVFPLLTVILPGQGGYTGSHDYNGPREGNAITKYASTFDKKTTKKSKTTKK